ncbi:helix-turn-helix transcriptional regulator [Streptomyces sp. NPDC097640]|uniref:PadR family transcriptional regulator n=1 Tax=Streptomyces sp. NPDC097640 TaxID=3157229 RepID=UPI0033229CC0
MPPVFAHGRLRLYLLKLLDEAPRHGYEVIRLLEERFQGLYAPSAGTVYPRLAKLEAEGLVTHTTEGGRKVYSITDAGRAELADRGGELADLEVEIRESVAELAAEIREDVRGSASDLRREMREAAQQARTSGNGSNGSGGPGGSGGSAEQPGPSWEGPWGDKEAWRLAKEEMRRAKDEWKEQARRAKQESRRARQDAQRARQQAKDAQDFAREEMQRMARRLQEQTQEHLRAGDWQRAVREGLAEVSRGMGRISRQNAGGAERAEPEVVVERVDLPEKETETETAAEAGPEPEWARDFSPSGDPARDLDRLLDRFRDDIRDTARDHGVNADQAAEARRRLAATAARINALLRGRTEE